MAQRTLQQVTRINAGILEYGWRPVADGRGDPTEIVWTLDTATPSGYKEWLMNESQYGNNGAAGRGQWAVCPMCQETFPISEMVYLKGRYYCTKNGDAVEMQSDT